ncbi:arsenate reductase [Rhizobium halophytocola]|uniref:Arsenate reductase n=2 Tax=Rhizobium halophytocola TaxID=735519 RepID=A0ABS4E002_9HYPH|nr:arsenate reductase [Rhizobium halophytocola]MBP1851267.1 arsenate reductase [Rhizobium halophytocola]
MLTIHGIKTSDTMKRARTWLDDHGIAYVFHDYKVSGIDRQSLERWCAAKGWDTVLNRAGTTFRKLDEAAKSGLDQDKAIALMLEQPSMIKRPMLEGEGVLVVGFKPEIYAAELKA